jgi:DNA-binding XRE family transcriptional regulator
MVIEIKHRVQEFRIAKKMSKSALARRIGADRSYITKVENGQFQPSGPVMLRFAHVLQRPVADIFQLIDVPHGEAAFHPISRRASVRAGEPTITAEISKREER